MADLLKELKRSIVLNNIRDRIERDRMDVTLPENHLLMFQLSGPTSYSYVSYHGDHAATPQEMAQIVFDRAPNPHGSQAPPVDYGAIFDTRTEGILAYMFRVL